MASQDNVFAPPQTRTPQQEDAQLKAIWQVANNRPQPTAGGGGSGSSSSSTNPFDHLDSKYSSALSALRSDSQFSAVSASFDESKGAAGRVADITSKDNPLMTLARTRAAQKSAANGQSNSSMATQAGEAAVIETATPLAQTDAQLYQQTQIENMRAANDAAARNAAARTQIGLEGIRMAEAGRQFDVSEAGQNSRFDKDLAVRRDSLDAQNKLDRDKLTESSRQFDVGQANADAHFNTELAEKSRQFDTSEANKISQSERDNATRITVAQMDANSRKEVATLENNWRLELSRNEKISAGWGTMMENINRLQNNKELDPATRQAYIQQSLDQFEAFATFNSKLTGSKIDISDLLQFSTTPPSSGSGGGGGSGDGAKDGPNVRNWRDESGW